jgi:hypothetical protein
MFAPLPADQDEVHVNPALPLRAMACTALITVQTHGACVAITSLPGQSSRLTAVYAYTCAGPFKGLLHSKPQPYTTSSTMM